MRKSQGVTKPTGAMKVKGTGQPSLRQDPGLEWSGALPARHNAGKQEVDCSERGGGLDPDYRGPPVVAWRAEAS